MTPIEAALAAIASEEDPNYAAVAEKYGCDRSTLSRRHRGITGSKTDARSSKSLLSMQQQKDLVNYINRLTARGLPPTHSMVANFAQDICHKSPGKNWVTRFIRSNRDELSSGYLTGQDLSRKKADNIYQYKLYFELV